MNAKQFIDDATTFALTAAGYDCDLLPETWEDVGGPESGPKLVGGPEVYCWSIRVSEHAYHELIADARDGEVYQSEIVPAGYGSANDLPF